MGRFSRYATASKFDISLFCNLLSAITTVGLLVHQQHFALVTFAKKHFALLEEKLPYDPVCPSSVGWSVSHNFLRGRGLYFHANIGTLVSFFGVRSVHIIYIHTYLCLDLAVRSFD